MKQTVILLSLIFLLFSVTHTQDPGFADIYGKVVLTDGSAIPGVTITLSGDKIGNKITMTSEFGNFRFLRLPPGKYDLKTELNGFKTIIRKGDLGINLAGYFGLERMPEFQNIRTTFDEFYHLGINLNYKNLRASLGAVDYEKGFKWETVLSGFYVNKKLFPRVYTNLDLGFPLPINHSAIWLRSSMGHAWGDREEPFANFYFGGFGNNWVDHRDYSRYRKYYSFPGIELNEVGGRNFGKLVLEWTLPPILFKKLGSPSFYANWASVSFFSSGLMTNIDSEQYRRTLVDIGVQLDIRFMVLSNHQITLSLGYARAFEEGREDSDQWMISLKLL